MFLNRYIGKMNKHIVQLINVGAILHSAKTTEPMSKPEMNQELSICWYVLLQTYFLYAKSTTAWIKISTEINPLKPTMATGSWK